MLLRERAANSAWNVLPVSPVERARAVGLGSVSARNRGGGLQDRVEKT